MVLQHRKQMMTNVRFVQHATLTAALTLAVGCPGEPTVDGSDPNTPSSQAADPSTWYRAAFPNKPATGGAGTTHEQPGSGDSAPLTPQNPPPESDPSNPPVDAGTSEPDPIEEPPAPVVVPTATLVFSESPTMPADPSQAPQQFSVQSVRELFIHSVWSNLTGEHSEIRKFYSPSGELYYQKLTPFSTDLEAPVPFERSVGIPHARTVQATPLDANGHVVVADHLSVAGTWISDRAMTGIWSVEIYLDDATSPSVRSDLELVP